MVLNGNISKLLTLLPQKDTHGEIKILNKHSVLQIELF